MENTDELDDANEGLPMDVESTDAAVADEVEPTTISAAGIGVNDKGEQSSPSELSSGTCMSRGV